MNRIQLIGAVELGLIFSLVSLGVYLSFRTLKFPDLTVDGSFPLGAAVCAILITSGVHPALATFISILAGVLSGWITAWLSTYLKILDLLSGILTMTALYSINIRIMGKPNIPLLGEKTLLDECFFWVPISNHIVPLFIIIMIVYTLVLSLLNTQIGLALRAVGSNAKMGRAQGINDKHMVWLGLGLSNGLVSLAGALFAQTQGFADVSMGVGIIIIGLAAVIIGESVLSGRKIYQALFACLIGSIVYRVVIGFALNIHHFGLQASDLNLVTTLLVIIAMLLPSLKRRFF